MKKNVGTADKIIRLLIAVVLIVVYFSGLATGVLGIIFLVAAAILALTALVNFCPLYYALGLSTCAVKKRV